MVHSQRNKGVNKGDSIETKGWRIESSLTQLNRKLKSESPPSLIESHLYQGIKARDCCEGNRGSLHCNTRNGVTRIRAVNASRNIVPFGKIFSMPIVHPASA
jgi:hypothetical protein